MTREQILDEVHDKRTKCMSYSRCMGYYTPIERFNIGKTGEHQERVKFKEKLTHS